MNKGTSPHSTDDVHRQGKLPSAIYGSPAQNSGGISPGSTLIILIFSMLCLTIFALISLATAGAEKSMSDASARTVVGYYEADTLAECILAEIMEADTIPDTVRGIEVLRGEEHTVMFACPVSDNKELFVEARITGGTCDIRQWRMRDAGGWEADEDLPVWIGD